METPRVFLTKNGLEKLQAEYDQLVKKERPALSERLLRAREAGDLSENADYHSAREKQAFVEGRIIELEELLKHAEVVAESGAGCQVGVGSRVQLEGPDGEVIFEVVGAPEANPAQGKISYESPLGKSLLGKDVGDEVKFDTPEGEAFYRVAKVF